MGSQSLYKFNLQYEIKLIYKVDHLKHIESLSKTLCLSILFIVELRNQLKNCTYYLIPQAF